MVSSGNDAREAFALRRVLLGVAVAVVVVAATVYLGYVALRYHALEEIRDWDSGLSPATIQFTEFSQDQEVCDALVLRIEESNWDRISSEAQYLLETKGVLGLKRLSCRIDGLLAQRYALPEPQRRKNRLDARLFKLSWAWISLVNRRYPGMRTGEPYFGSEEEKRQFISAYREAKVKLLGEEAADP